MTVTLKTPAEIAAMREGGQILAMILQELGKRTEIGMATRQLDEIAEDLFRNYQVQPSFKNYQGYPASICTAVNEEVVHAIPSDRILKPGDIISLDAGVWHRGLHTDAAITVCLEPVAVSVKQFVQTVEKTLHQALKVARPGAKVGDISHIIQKNIELNGYGVVHELTGHGVGREIHEPPQIPNYGKKNSGEALVPGMTLAIEPIATLGQRYIKTLPDRWTIVTRDGSYACQIEHTIVITQHGNEILTKIPAN